MITTDLRLNEPRYVKLPDIMKAKKNHWIQCLGDLSFVQGQRLKLVKVEPPPNATGVAARLP